MLRWFFLMLILLATAQAKAASWQTVDAPRSMGTKWVASVTNADGHTLRVFRKIARAGYEAFAEVSLSKGEKFGDTMPSYRIDQGKMEDATIIKIAGDNMGLRWGYVEGDRSGWRIWQGTDTLIEDNPALAPWLKGSRITVMYTDSKGKSRKTEFSLSGSSNAISQALTGPFQ